MNIKQFGLFTFLLGGIFSVANVKTAIETQINENTFNWSYNAITGVLTIFSDNKHEFNTVKWKFENGKYYATTQNGSPVKRIVGYRWVQIKKSYPNSINSYVNSN